MVHELPLSSFYNKQFWEIKKYRNIIFGLIEKEYHVKTSWYYWNNITIESIKCHIHKLIINILIYFLSNNIYVFYDQHIFFYKLTAKSSFVFFFVNIQYNKKIYNIHTILFINDLKFLIYFKVSLFKSVLMNKSETKIKTILFKHSTEFFACKIFTF